jgi:SSS family solute:Na+ symporter
MYFPLGLVDWSICLVVLGSSIFLGMYLSVRKKSSTNSSRFFLADRSLTWPLVGASLFATNIGAEHLVGLSGDAYRYGLSAGTVELTTCWTLGFAAAFLFPFYIPN